MIDDDKKPNLRLLSSLQLERFKAAFKPDAIPLRLFNVVIGRNGSGKSTMLEALQWLDATMRRDAREACDRYFGIGDLINLRSQTLIPFFRLILTWKSKDKAARPLRYTLKVEEKMGMPVIATEELVSLRASGYVNVKYLTTTTHGERTFSGVSVREPDRLALGIVGSVSTETTDPTLAFLPGYWARAVFLRLSPNRLAQGSLATRRSFEPLLDEEGQNLPALINELTRDQRERLIEAMQEMLPGIRNVRVSEAAIGRDTRVNYSLLEQMPYQGRRGRSQFPIPSWMLSEGTRRITAILALLVREPPPSLLCIEEIENGLDPWTVRAVLRYLEAAGRQGTQVVVTTHSPWVLDAVPIESILQVRRTDGDTRYEHFASRAEIKAFSPSVPAGTRYINAAQNE